MRQAIGYFEQAVARDPSYARACLALGCALAAGEPLAGKSTEEEVPRARRYAITALALDGSLAEAHWAMAQVLFGYDWNWPAAELNFSAPFSWIQDSRRPRHLYVIALMHQGGMDEAAAGVAMCALEIDPLLAAAHHTFGRLYVYTGRPDQAIAHLDEALALNPGFSLVHAQLGRAYLPERRCPLKRSPRSRWQH